MQNMIHGTKVLRPPKHLIATFGTTTMNYVILSEMPDNPKQCRLREGKVITERPQILTPDLWQKRFEGFGENQATYKEAMEQLYGDAFRALEYRFKNELSSSSIEQTPLAEMTDRTMRLLEEENAPRKTLLQAPDTLWSLSVMKFIVDISFRSFPSNVQELDEHGFFNPAKRAEEQQRRAIELLFREATMNPAAIKKLSERLKQAGLFSEYEDRFFALVRNSRGTNV